MTGDRLHMFMAIIMIIHLYFPHLTRPWRTLLEQPRFFIVTEGTNTHQKNSGKKIVDAGMTQSMSRVAHCIDNGPMEGFWGIMKREMYYGHKFKTKEELLQAIEEYMTYYATKRVQRNLNVMTPLEYHEIKLKEIA